MSRVGRGVKVSTSRFVSGTTLCVCCLNFCDQSVKLRSCTHLGIFEDTWNELKIQDVDICLFCHRMFIKFNDFKKQVDDSIQKLNDQTAAVSTSRKYINMQYTTPLILEINQDLSCNRFLTVLPLKPTPEPEITNIKTEIPDVDIKMELEYSGNSINEMMNVMERTINTFEQHKSVPTDSSTVPNISYASTLTHIKSEFNDRGHTNSISEEWYAAVDSKPDHDYNNVDNEERINISSLQPTTSTSLQDPLENIKDEMLDICENPVKIEEDEEILDTSENLEKIEEQKEEYPYFNSCESTEEEVVTIKIYDKHKIQEDSSAKFNNRRPRAAHSSERKRGAKSREEIKTGLNLIRQGMSIRKASKECGVAYATLKRYHWKTVHAENLEGQRLEPNYSTNKIFNTEQERSLKEHFTNCASLFYGLTKRECQKIAYQCAVINNIKYPKKWETEQMAGKDWLKFFQRRNGVCAKKPEACILARATSFIKLNIDLFFNNLESLVARNPAFADGTRIFNLDEISTEVIAPKGAKGIPKVTNDERGTLVTTCCIISAGGNALPPVIVFPRKHFEDHMIINTPPGTLGLATSSGLMNNELFPSVMGHFIKQTNSSEENPSILILDNHESHLSLEAIEMAKNSGVHILTLHPHMSEKLQPLISIYDPFKNYCNAALESWLIKHPSKPITMYDLGEVITTAFQKSMTPTNIVQAFAKCGIYPFDRNIFTDIDLLPSTSDVMTDRSCPECLNRLGHVKTLSTSDTLAIDPLEPQQSETMNVDSSHETQSQSSQAVPLPNLCTSGR